MFGILYLGLFLVQFYVALKQRHPLTYIFTATIFVQLLGNVFHLSHLFKFSNDGEGIESINITGEIADILAQVTKHEYLIPAGSEKVDIVIAMVDQMK